MLAGFLSLLVTQGARAAITLTIEQIPGQAAVPGGTLGFEVFVVSTETILVTGVQVDLPCVVAPEPGGVGSLSTSGVMGAAISVGNQSSPASGAVPWLFAPDDTLQGGLRLISAAACRAGGAYSPGEGPYTLPANKRRYVATIRYRISSCAFGTFHLGTESLSWLAGAETLPLPFAFEPLALLFGSACPCTADSDCADGLMCSGDEFCNEGWCRSTPTACAGEYCDEKNDRCLECLSDVECEDLNSCTVDDCRDGFCRNEPGRGPCDDAATCTGDDRCRSGVCLGDDSCSPGWTCDSEQGACVALTCADSRIKATEPASGIVDARQPHSPNGTLFADQQGIGSEEETIRLVLETSNVDVACFRLCETLSSAAFGDNAALPATPVGGKAFLVPLLRPITAGAVTTIGYLGGDSVEYTYHPGNVDGNPFADSDDVLVLAEYLASGLGVPHDSFSADINRSGEPDVVDLVRLVDLLAGAGDYEVWSGSPLPVNAVCP